MSLFSYSATLVGFLLLSIGCQLVMTLTFVREALTTTQGKYCIIKCGLAAMLYSAVGLLLTWGLRIVLTR